MQTTLIISGYFDFSEMVIFLTFFFPLLVSDKNVWQIHIKDKEIFITGAIAPRRKSLKSCC